MNALLSRAVSLPGTLLGKLLAWLHRYRWIKFTFDVFARFGKDNGGLLAAGLAFFLVLAIIPLLLVGLWVLGLVYVNKPDEAVSQIQNLLSSRVLPGVAATEVSHLMERAQIKDATGHAGPTLLNLLHGHGFAGIAGLLGVVWAAIQVFINASTAMNAAWETPEKRNWFVLRGVALGLLVGTGILLVLSLAVTGLSTSFSNSQFAHLVPFEGAVIAGLIELGAVIVSGLMYAVTFKYLPSAEVSWKSALIGGFTAAIAFEIAKKGLSVLLLKPNKTLYSELGNLIGFILWIYYSMMILLLGAEVSSQYSSEIERKRSAHLKRAALATPAADPSAGSGPSPERSKLRDGVRRTRPPGGKQV